jgi:hypothetical protein
MSTIISSRAESIIGKSAPEETVEVTDWATEGEREAEGVEPPWRRDIARFGGIAESFVTSKKLYKKLFRYLYGLFKILTLRI